MLPLPAPYPDELAYSILARFAERTTIGTSAVLKEVFGFRTALSADLQASATALAASLYPTKKRSGEEVIKAHTTFNYYAAAWTPELASKYAEMLCSKKGSKNILGARSRSLARASSMLQACERCMKENIREFGEAYWHRKHQLPGVRRCVLHGCELLESDIPLEAKTKLQTAASARFVRRRRTSFSRKESVILKEIERCAVSCLNEQYHSKLAPQGTLLRSYLFKLGVIPKEMDINWQEFLSHVRNILGKRVIKFTLGRDVGVKWLQACVGYPYKCRPIYIILLTVFCARWQMRHNKRIQSTATAVSSKSISKAYLDQQKQKYLILYAAGSKHLPRKYIWKFIRRWDPDWLRALPRRYRKRPPTVDWHKRDKFLVAQCRACVIRLRASVPPVRILPAAILREMTVPSDRTKTPCFFQELAQQTEPLDEWRKRKILFAIETKGDDLRTWSVRKILDISGLVSCDCSEEILAFCGTLVRERASRCTAKISRLAA